MALLIYPHAADERPQVEVRFLPQAPSANAPVQVEIITPLGSDTWQTHTLTEPTRPADEGSGAVINTLQLEGRTIPMPAQWSVRTGATLS